ncbi:DUF397 domain-containing protein [Streptomyces luteolus]|uniref:DUF397 domain-containing protein n=1 Tax=Streptomyces luteolus TaxID=3043615 RepID=A0ABT6SVB3_9ACTN|nr:DUF397 domain-containing protein [Streptomyces sp. B-S-A12]MDI3419534.1 DUF397 domain-containing protein [Streptomyces sp. B-S-A12]
MPKPTWQRSSYCASGDSCVHVAHGPQKSSYCGEGDSCIHVDATPDRTVLLTESSDPTGAILTTTPEAFAALLTHLKGVGESPGIGIAHGPADEIRLHTPDTVVTTTREKWHTFTLGVRAGEFDHFAA